MAEPKIVIRTVTKEDFPLILRLNEENVEVLSPMDEKGAALFGKWAEKFLVAEVDGRFAAFLIAFREGVDDYWSENYKWFAAKYSQFLYIDRIVIDEPYRKCGLGRRLYRELMDHARNTKVPVVTAEIDTEPVYNEASLRFHDAMGFREVGTQYVRDGKIKVSLQAAEVAGDVP